MKKSEQTFRCELCCPCPWKAWDLSKMVNSWLSLNISNLTVFLFFTLLFIHFSFSVMQSLCFTQKFWHRIVLSLNKRVNWIFRNQSHLSYTAKQLQNLKKLWRSDKLNLVAGTTKHANNFLGNCLLTKNFWKNCCKKLVRTFKKHWQQSTGTISDYLLYSVLVPYKFYFCKLCFWHLNT